MFIELRSQESNLCDQELSTEIVRQYSLLDSSYRYKNEELKENFFVEWFNLSRELNKSYKIIDSIKIAIDYFFHDIYFPDTESKRYYDEFMVFDSLSKKYDSIKIQWNGCFINAKYFVVQSQIRYLTYTDSIFSKLYYMDKYEYEKQYFADTIIIDFYPNIDFFNKKSLYLTEDYKKLFDKYFFCPKMRYPKYLKVDSKRVFLQPEVEFSRSHDPWFYHYITFPEISHIQFNESNDKAKVNFRTSFNTGGYARYEKINSYWRRVEYQRESWIQ